MLKVYWLILKNRYRIFINTWRFCALISIFKCCRKTPHRMCRCAHTFLHPALKRMGEKNKLSVFPSSVFSAKKARRRVSTTISLIFTPCTALLASYLSSCAAWVVGSLIPQKQHFRKTAQQNILTEINFHPPSFLMWNSKGQIQSSCPVLQSCPHTSEKYVHRIPKGLEFFTHTYMTQFQSSG